MWIRIFQEHRYGRCTIKSLPENLKIAFNTQSPIDTPVDPECKKAVEEAVLADDQSAKYLGGKEPKKVEAPKETDGDQGDPAGQGRYKIEHKGRGKWAIVDTETGEQVGDKTYPKKTAESVVKMSNEGPGAPVAASIEPE